MGRAGLVAVCWCIKMGLCGWLEGGEVDGTGDDVSGKLDEEMLKMFETQDEDMSDVVEIPVVPIVPSQPSPSKKMKFSNADGDLQPQTQVLSNGHAHANGSQVNHNHARVISEADRMTRTESSSSNPYINPDVSGSAVLPNGGTSSLLSASVNPINAHTYSQHTKSTIPLYSTQNIDTNTNTSPLSPYTPTPTGLPSSAAFFQSQLQHQSHPTPTSTVDPITPTKVLPDTLDLVQKAIAVVRRRRSVKAIETYEQVKFLVEFVEYLRSGSHTTGREV